ncbi:hypothetical protein AB0L41_42810 [Amycolatopsis mediterranei]|uniref:hypothetical protein n=1 Tax=Amycolatopsis mediterranei TaxID=33910 RepID=UPI00343D5871
MSWQEERRANLAAKAQQARLDQAAATGDEIARMKAASDVARADREQAAELARQAKEAAAAKRKQRRDDRKERWATIAAFARGHVAHVLIYSIAVVSFVMAASAMAGYGAEVYASGVGRLLPLITELGMWAFAVSVQIMRRKDRTRSVWGLKVGVWVFGALAFGTNAVHGLARGWDAMVIMGVVSVAGVIAHQLAIADPPRSRAQRAADKLAAAQVAKTNAAARAALKMATAQIDADGNARLTFAPGTYEVKRGRLTRGRLIPVAPDPDVPGPPDALDAAIADLLDSSGPAAGPDRHSDGEPDTETGGGVATADKPAGHPDDTGPARPVSRPAPRTSRRTAPAERTTGDAHMAVLRTRLAAAVAAGELDPATATPYRIAKTIRCGKPAAKKLRAELDNPTQR